MGGLFYGAAAAPIRIDDELLAHLKLVIITKLRRGESFTVTWQHPEGEVAGRTTIWLNSSIPLRFVFDDPDGSELSRELVETLATAANSTGGIVITADHVESADDDLPPA